MINLKIGRVTDIKKVFDDFSQKNVLVIGDVMIDAYLWGNVQRISPEAPVPIVSVDKKEQRMGGAANVALNLKYLGANPIIASVVGTDEIGDVFISLMEKRNLSVKGVLRTEERKTTQKTRVISDGQQLLRIDDEISNTLSENLIEKFLQRIERLISEENIDIIIFEDYDKGVISKDLISAVVEMATKASVLTCVDPKKENYNFYTGVNLFKPNFKEFTEGIKKEIAKNDIDTIFLEAKKIIKEKKYQYLMVTLSEHGVFISDGESYHIVPAELRQIADVSGAGDTVISVAALLLASSLNMQEIAKYSNIAGGLVCEKVGVVPIKKQELLKEILS